MKVSDFRSDTVTRPSPAMREAMATAEVGDDVLDGDPTVRRLEERAAAWLGMERALFVPSGTQANQVALGAWCRPGDEVILEADAHMIRFEAGAMAALHGAQSCGLPGRRGALDPEAVRASLRPADGHSPRTGLVCVEQTHMLAGGVVLPPENLRAVHAVARGAGVPVHMDGARLANAVAATGRPAAELTACADSVALCFSKGLGAPVGSVVAGPADFIQRAHGVRKRLGGWMRQAGVLAAPALLALEQNVERLADDHALARELAAVADRFAALACPPDEVPTNIVQVRILDPELDGPGLAQRLKDEGVLVLSLVPRSVRFVTHLDVGPEDVERLERALTRILGPA